jgi:hypothetical protein
MGRQEVKGMHFQAWHELALVLEREVAGRLGSTYS